MSSTLDSPSMEAFFVVVLAAAVLGVGVVALVGAAPDEEEHGPDRDPQER